MITHIIYHIPNRKVGCTRNLRDRKLFYKQAEGFIPEIEVLEKLHNHTDQQAGDREWWWADKLGYKKKGNHYAQTLKNTTGGPFRSNIELKKLGGHRGGKKTSALGKNPGVTMDKAILIAAGRKGAAAGLRSGKGSFRNMARDKLILISILSGRKRAFAADNPFHTKSTCPHCGIEGQLASLKRWHFENCKSRRTF